MFIIGDTVEDKICGYYLDNQQQKIVLDESKQLLVVAGAGSGKTLTIIGKIYYLIKYKNINPSEIMCISFTKESSNNLKDKIKKELNCEVPVYTFHKLSLEIIKENKINYHITDVDMLENIISDFLNNRVLKSERHMKMVLNYFNQYPIINVKEKYLHFLKYNYPKIQMLSNIILSFIHLFKCNNYSLNSFKLFLKQSRKILNILNYKNEKILLTLILNIYIAYQNYLEETNEIDFDDMIIKATEIVEKSGIKQKYKYVIIDEYQDTSYIRFCLVKSILEKCNSNLMVVGDDFQSIYRFTGCDLSLFVDFKKYFNDAKIMKIETTYRNSQELISIAGDFVMKNKNQMKKNLNSNKNLSKPIRIIYYRNVKETFLNLVLKVYNDTNKPILVLGRNNKDINLVLGDNFKLKQDKLICLKMPEIKIRFLTVHKSKGLEEESVIIINLENNLLGFPNKIKNEKILRFVSKNSEKYPYSEERRLFYVALTRTRGYVYLLTQKNNSSIFLEELLKSYKDKINIINSFL